MAGYTVSTFRMQNMNWKSCQAVDPQGPGPSERVPPVVLLPHPCSTVLLAGDQVFKHVIPWACSSLSKYSIPAFHNAAPCDFLLHLHFQILVAHSWQTWTKILTQMWGSDVEWKHIKFQVKESICDWFLLLLVGWTKLFNQHGFSSFFAKFKIIATFVARHK